MKNTLWFIGGYNGFDYTNEIQKYDMITNTFALVEATGEPFSRRSALTALVWRDSLYTFGGWNGFTRAWYNDLYCFHFPTSRWRWISPAGQLPGKRTSHAAVVYNNKMYVFGGFSGEEYLNDLHEFNLENETWRNLSAQCKGDIPAPRSRFCAAVHGDSMYILGGWNKVGYFNDFYKFDFARSVWTKIANINFSIPTISQYSLAVDEKFLYIFGGFCGREKTCINKLYKYRLESSTQAS